MLSKFLFTIKNNLLKLLLLIVFFICSITLVGWVSNIDFLQNFNFKTGWIKMIPITAIGIISTSLAIYFIAENKFKKIAFVLAGFFFFVAIITAVNSITKTDVLNLRVLLGISIDPEIIVHITSIEFILLNLSILLIFSSKKQFHLISEVLATLAFSIASVFFIGYIYGIGELQDIKGFSSMAIQTAICIILLAFCVLRISPKKIIIGVFLEETNLSKISRQYVFIVFFIILFIGWVRLLGQRLGLYHTEVGFGIMIMVFILTCFFLVRDGVRIITIKENIKIKEAQLKLANEINFKTTLDRIAQGFLTLNKDDKITYVNKTVSEFIGKSFEELFDKNFWDEIPETVGHQFQMDCFEAISKQIYVSNKSYYPPLDKWFDYDIYPSQSGLSIFFRDITERYEFENQINKSNERFNLINKATDEALWECNLITKELWVNEMHQNLYGLTLNNPIPTEEEWISRIHPDDRELIISTHDLNLRSKEKIFTSEYRFFSNNEYINIYDRVYFVRDEDDNPIRIMGNMMDITHLKKIEEKLENSKTHLQTILDNAPQCIKLLNRNGFLLEMNKRGVEMLEAQDFDEIRDKSVVGLINEIYQKDFRKLIDSVFHGNNENLQFEITTLKGNTKWLETHSVPLHNKQGEISALLAVTNDITERKNIEIQLSKSFEEVRRLTKHLQNIREEERTFISRELHDELGQQLAAMKMDLGWVSKRLKEAEEPVREKTKALMDQISLLIKSVRKISFDLRPSTLSDFGLSAAMEQYLKNFEERSEIKISFNRPIFNPELNDTVKTSLYRIFQESITNISRHAQAQNILIELNFFDDKIILVIQDDGIGFNEEILKTNKTLGIIGMKERVIILDGEFEIVSEPNKGTSIKVVIPYLEN